MSGVSGGPEPKIGDQVEFSGVGKVSQIYNSEPTNVYVIIDDCPGISFVLPRSSVRVVVPPLKAGDEIFADNRQRLLDLPEGSAFLYAGSVEPLGQPGLFQVADDTGWFKVAGESNHLCTDEIPLPVQVLWVGAR